MWTAKIKVKESDYGKPLGLLYKLGWYWLYYSTAQHKKKGEEKAANDYDDKSNLLTIQAHLFPTLIAVTPKQNKGWAKQGIKYVHHWAWANKLITKWSKK